jgi:hypothetical protein
MLSKLEKTEGRSQKKEVGMISSFRNFKHLIDATETPKHKISQKTDYSVNNFSEI